MDWAGAGFSLISLSRRSLSCFSFSLFSRASLSRVSFSLRVTLSFSSSSLFFLSSSTFLRSSSFLLVSSLAFSQPPFAVPELAGPLVFLLAVALAGALVFVGPGVARCHVGF